MYYTFEQAGRLLENISGETRGKNLTDIERHVFNSVYYKGLLEQLIVENKEVAKYLEERLDTVRKLSKLGKL
jgi:hypothetical protein